MKTPSELLEEICPPGSRVVCLSCGQPGLQHAKEILLAATWEDLPLLAAGIPAGLCDPLGGQCGACLVGTYASKLLSHAKGEP